MPVLLGAVEDDDEQEAVAAAVTAMGPFLQTEACNAHAQEVSAAILKILRGQALCQEVASDDEAGEDTLEDVEVSTGDSMSSYTECLLGQRCMLMQHAFMACPAGN